MRVTHVRRCVPCTNAPLMPGVRYTSPGAPTPFDNNCAWTCNASYTRATVARADDAGCVRATREECQALPPP